MTNVEMYINNELVDLFGGEVIAATLQIGSFGDISARQSNYTNNFSLPLSGRNRSILESPEVVLNDSSLPYTALACRIEVDGIPVVEGFAQITSVTDVINVRVYSGNYDFYTIIKAKKLSELDLLSYNHVWNVANVKASMVNTSGYIYALIDYHSDSPNSFLNNVDREIDYRFMYFSLYMHTLISKIVSEAGYTITGDILTNADYLKIALAFSNDSYLALPADGFNALTSARVLIPPGFQIIQFNNDSTNGGYDTGGNFNTATYRYTVPSNGTINFKVLLNLFSEFNLNKINIRICKNSTDGSNTIGTGNFEKYLTINSDTASCETGFVSVQAGDFISVFINVFKPGGGSFYVDPLSSFTLEQQEDAEPGDTIDVARNMPNISQGALFKLWLQMSGAYTSVDNNTKVVTVKRYSEIINNIENAVDWSDKIDETEPDEIEFSMDNYGQNNNFNYKEDESVSKPDGTDYVMKIQNENLVQEVDLVESPFAASEQVERMIGIDMCQIKKVTAGELSEKTEPRIVIIDLTTAGTTIDFTDGVSVVDSTDDYASTHFISPSHTFNLGWGSSLSDNLVEIENTLNGFKALGLLLRLTTLDIAKLDFFIPVWIDKYSMYFYISKVNQFKINEFDSTRVDLIKLPL